MPDDTEYKLQHGTASAPFALMYGHSSCVAGHVLRMHARTAAPLKLELPSPCAFHTYALHTCARWIWRAASRSGSSCVRRSAGGRRAAAVLGSGSREPRMPSTSWCRFVLGICLDRVQIV